MRRPLPWFRMYTDFLSDPKMISLAFEDQRHFIGVLALKSGGVLDQQCEPRVLDRIVAQRLWVDYAIVEDLKKRLVGADLIDESWSPKAWNKRQFVSDADPTGAERAKRYRDSKAPSRVTKDGVTLPDTDTDTDTEESREEPTADQSRDEFEQAWALYPKRPNNNKSAAWRAWCARINAKEDPAALIDGVKRYQLFCVAEGKIDTQFVKQASTFFGPDKWYEQPWTASTQPNTRREHRAAWTSSRHQPGSNHAAGNCIDV